MPKIILRCNYLQNAPSEHLTHFINYIATRDGAEPVVAEKSDAPATLAQQKVIAALLKHIPDASNMLEYQDYVLKPTSENASEFITMALENNLDLVAKKKNYIDYLSNRPRAERLGSHGLFRMDGSPLVLSTVADEVANHEGVIWTNIISLRREDAARLGYDSAEQWQSYLATKLAMFAEHFKISAENLKAYAAFHNESHHPHVHVVIYSQNPKEGFLTKHSIEQMRSQLAHDLFRAEFMEIYAEQTARRDKLKAVSQKSMETLIQEMRNHACNNPEVERLMQELIVHLGRTKGKLQYGYLSPPIKRIIDRIVDELEKEPPVREAYEKWYEMRNAVLLTYMKTPPPPLPLSEQKEFKSIKNMIIREAKNIMEGVFTFEGDNEQDATAEDEADKKASSFTFYDDYRNAKKQLDSGESNEVSAAIKWLEDNAADNEWVQYTLGKVYRDEKYGVRDVQKAIRYFTLAAEHENEFAFYALGKLYLQDDTAKDVATAMKWLELAAKHNNQFALYTLGKLYLTGEDIPKDIEKAIELLTRSAEKGNQFAQYALGKLYLMGKDVSRDKETALKWLTASAAQGNQYAQFFIDHFDSFKDPSVLLAATRLLHRLSKVFEDTASPPKGNPLGQIDRKRMKQLRQKKMAQGHAEDEQIQVL